MKIDEDGNPAGGTSKAIGIDIRWQDGPIPKTEKGEPMQSPNGAFVEGVIEAAIQRIQFFQTATNGKFACRQNALALTKLEEALHWLDDRTAERIKRNVEGSHQV